MIIELATIAGIGAVGATIADSMNSKRIEKIRTKNNNERTN
jgi:hypothetical protein